MCDSRQLAHFLTTLLYFMRAAQLRLTADMRVSLTPSFVTFRFVRFDIFVSNLIQLRPLSLASDYHYI